MVENFSIQFSPLYMPMKYLAIISRHPVWIYDIHEEELKNNQNYLKNVFFYVLLKDLLLKISRKIKIDSATNFLKRKQNTLIFLSAVAKIAKFTHTRNIQWEKKLVKSVNWTTWQTFLKSLYTHYSE